MEKNLNSSTIKMTSEQHQKFHNFITGDDLDFYEEFIIHLSDEQQTYFFKENPDFMSDFPISHKNFYLLKDKLFRRILRSIKTYEDTKKTNADTV